MIAAQPPPSAQDFSDFEQALIGGRGDEDLQAKTDSVKAALQWVRRFDCLRCYMLLQAVTAHRFPLADVDVDVLRVIHLHVAHDFVSLRRDAKLPAAPSSSLAKAGSILTKAVGNLVGGSSGSAVTQVPHVLVPPQNCSC